MRRHPGRTRDTAPNRSASRRSGGGTLLGIFIGLILGLAVASVVAFLMVRSPNLLQSVTRRDAARPAAEPAPPGPAAPSQAGPAPGEATKGPEKPRFDFYKILPGTEEAKPRSEKRSEQARAGGAEAPGAPFYLQAGAFASPAEAEDQKAKLALLGWEATIAVATVPDRGMVHRVRVGPFRNVDEMNQAKTELARIGFETAVIRNP
jgi:cell division protein FtsN